MEIDIREFHLKKWYMPKEKSSLKDTNDMYYAIGYFDFIDVKKVEDKEERIHPWKLSYNNSYRFSGEFQSDCFVQEIKAFTNITEEKEKGFSKQEIEEFWEDNTSLLCMSMLHLTNGVTLESVIFHITDTMKDTKYLYYFTYDYSGIIIVARDICIKKYLECMFCLNYNNCEHKKLIRDTFSIYGFQREKYFNFSQGILSNEHILNIDEELYEIAINISICNYEKYKIWKDEFDRFEKQNNYKSEEKKLAGRHDVSIVNKEADLYWLLKIHCLLDVHTSNENGALYAYETFIKTDKMRDYTDYYEKDSILYERIEKQLEGLYNKFQALAITKDFKSYVIPVREVCNSVLSIMKNGFAEDFIVCMYQPFIEFLCYIINKLSSDNKEYDAEFNKCFNEFFEGLNALVNSAMHTDRQFIQATSFGAIFYDIPPKIMAFYVAMIHNFYDVMKKDDKHKYTLFMTPGFSDEIHVKQISYEIKEAEDRVFQIFINESFLYHPEAVMRRLVHEIAHFEGDSLRNRPMRKRKLIETYICEILYKNIPFTYQETISLATEFIKIIESQKEFSYDKDYYSFDNDTLHTRVLTDIIEYGGYEELLKTYLEENLVRSEKKQWDKYFEYLLDLNETSDVLYNLGINEEQIEKFKFSQFQKKALVELMTEDILTNIKSYIKSVAEKYDPYMTNFARALISLYSETYADMQMILVLNYSYESYLRGFIEDEKLDYKKIKKQNEDISRIAVVTKLMKYNKIWDCEKTWNNDNNIGKKISELHEIIQTFITKMSDNEDPYYVQNKCLLEYLQQCFESSQDYYANGEYIDEPLPYKVKDKLETIRRDIKIVIEHKDVTDVYRTIDKVIREYKEFLKVQTIGEEEEKSMA